MTVLGILITVFLVLMLLSVPIAVAMGVASALALLIATDLPLVAVGQRMLVILDSFPFLALPFFILAGLFMEQGGITRRLVDFAAIFVGRITGGLAQVLVGANLVMSGTSGSSVADCAATGTVLIPAMAKAGYSRAFAAALTAAAATAGPLIPPSIMFVLYGAIANVSIGQLFIAGIVPGLFVGLYLGIAAYLISKKRQYPKLPPVTLREAAITTVKAAPALLMPIVVLGGIVGGVFTPTEAGAIAAVYGFVVSMFVYREMKWSHLRGMLVTTGVISAAVMLIVSAASLFSWILTRERAPELLAGALTHFTNNPMVFLLFINIILLVLGCFLEAISLLIMMTPILVPLAAAYGVDPVHFGIVVVLNLTIGLNTPPVGMNMFIVCAISKITVTEYTREALPFLLALLLVLLLITYVPQTVLWLPASLPS
ncbi:MAG: TRAP transporter large permease [Betaproteobacteria bacterium]|nr:MAG: TRAP transporter large permease [Betaproteobacteria bacterium]